MVGAARGGRTHLGIYRLQTRTRTIQHTCQ